MQVDPEPPAVTDATSAPTVVALTQPKVEEGRFSGSYTWKFDNVKNGPDKVYSELFEVGTYTWRILAFPRGNQRKPHLALYLDAPEACVLPAQMCPRASFTLTILNQEDETKSWSKDTTHYFTGTESDWGFTETILLDDLYNPRSGWLKDDTLLIRVSIQVHKDEAVLSRKTGFVGLKNQGATCYMNSLLQYLYNLPSFRKAVYHMPTSEVDDPANNMPLALQSLFFKLQYSATTVSTKDLTKSFGWNTADAFMQHDVQELNRVLCEKLEEKMKGTTVENVINDLFAGNTVNYIECVHVPVKSERKEKYYDLQLDVKGCRNIYDSFDRYVEVEMMDGPNQYQAEGHGLQDARKGVLFQSFPPVLQLQLKRFEYDFQRDAMVKINDRYEFYDELDLDRLGRKYLDGSADSNVRNTYKLHSVLVHSGGGYGGHYFAYVRPDGNTWLKFDDERVTVEAPERAMNDQFGDDTGEYGSQGGAGGMYGGNTGPMHRFQRSSNAYMLVYVRLEDWDRIMCKVSKDDLSAPLRSRFETELAAKELRRQEKNEAHLYVSVKVATDADIREQLASGGRAFDLVDHELLPPGRGAFRVSKKMRLVEFKALVERTLGVPVSQQRYWVWSRRANGTYRVSSVLEPGLDDRPLLDLKEHREQSVPQNQCKTALMDLRLYLETPQPYTVPYTPTELPLYSRQRGPGGTVDDVFLFAKLYDPYKERLSYVGRAYLQRNATVKDACKWFARLVVRQDQPMEVYEEVKPEPTLMVTALSPKMPLSELQQGMDGDILILQPKLDASEAKRLRLPTIQQYLEYVQQRRFVLFKPLQSDSESPAQPAQGAAQPGAGIAPSPSPPPQGGGDAMSVSTVGPQGPGVVAGGEGGGKPAVSTASSGRTGDAPTGAAAAATSPAAAAILRPATPAPPPLPPGAYELELRQNMTYEEVTATLAHALGLPPDGGALIRLTNHSQYTNSPQRQPVKNRSVTLQGLLAASNLGSFSLRHGSSGGVTVGGGGGAGGGPRLAAPNDILYYEVLDMPLEELEQLKTLKVHFHKANGEPGGDVTVRVRREENVGALLAEAARQLGPAITGGRPLRLLEQHSSKLYKMHALTDGVEQLDETGYWRWRVEAVPADEEGLDYQPHPETGERLLHCYHVCFDKPSGAVAGGHPPPAPAPVQGPAPMDVTTAAPGDSGAVQPPSSPTSLSQQPAGNAVSAPAATEPGPQASQLPPHHPLATAPTIAGNPVAHVTPNCFGDPILVRCGPNDSVADLRDRIQAKLGISAEDIAKFRWIYCVRGTSELLQDTDVPGTRWSRAGPTGGAGDSPYLGMEHEDDGKPRRREANTSRPNYDRPVKIYT